MLAVIYASEDKIISNKYDGMNTFQNKWLHYFKSLGY